MFMATPGHVLTGSEALDPELGISSVVFVPYSVRLVLGTNNELHAELTEPSEIDLRATVLAAEHHPDSKIIVPGEKTYKDQPGGTYLATKRAVESYDVPFKSIVPLYRSRGRSGRPLNNTYSQMRAVGRYLHYAGVRPQNTLIVPLRGHLQRTMEGSQDFGMRGANFVAAEDVLEEAGEPKYDTILSILAGLERSERIKRFIGQNKSGRMLMELAGGITGPCYLDIVETKEGDYKLVDGFAKTQERRILQRAATGQSKTT